MRLKRAVVKLTKGERGWGRTGGEVERMGSHLAGRCREGDARAVGWMSGARTWAGGAAFLPFASHFSLGRMGGEEGHAVGTRLSLIF